VNLRSLTRVSTGAETAAEGLRTYSTEEAFVSFSLHPEIWRLWNQCFVCQTRGAGPHALHQRLIHAALHYVTMQ
jgi:hypothetical protein